ncbi:hypothetical protein NQ176_g1049 [Zarea fungicola]|uniref:Uncharacterized protein n=1 Tax=Zarea fungicola TaxID=93591 RepID=A0ACC1NWU3_9HYPO|nr:hypothetical protein NQ176_g1049 [Lecanicillium fungicola]
MAKTVNPHCEHTTNQRALAVTKDEMSHKVHNFSSDEQTSSLSPPEFTGREPMPKNAGLELSTPLRRRELVPRSTAQPSTRRVRRLDGEKLAAANPLFQPWTMESSKKVLDFSRNISPRKGEPKLRNHFEQATGGSFLGSRRQTRHGANSALLNSTLLNTTISDPDSSSSSSTSEIDVGDVTLPASLQLMDQPTEFSQRMARLRQDTCITILEDSISADKTSPEADEQSASEDIAQGEEGEGQHGNASEPLSPKDANARGEFPMRLVAQAMPTRVHIPKSVEKENRDTTGVSLAGADDLAEMPADELLWGNKPSSESGVASNLAFAQRGLSSPRKAPLIPQGPHTPTKDDFWKQSLVDCWNDDHSPRKAVKAALRSPMKRSNPIKTGKASFEAVKSQLAIEFLGELDASITGGKIAELAESTGGVRIEWSKTLSTTAGRANWKKETIRTTPSDGSEPSISYNHHASIELAEKVIDDENRLLNVLAHEFCHLANFMISGITNSPHGKEFKHWAAKCCEHFSSRGINVTTKHSYEIDFKYVWQCEGCASSYKRHSKSINIEKHRCGACKGTLVQIKPRPRNVGKPSEYQVFITDEMKALKLENPTSPQKVIMQLAAEKWANRPRSTDEDVGDVAAQLLGLSLGD